jgi:hypothetical protein
MLIRLFLLLFWTTACGGAAKEKSPAATSETESSSGGYRIEHIGNFKGAISEASGIEISPDGKSLWTHGDNGQRNALYRLNMAGEMEEAIEIPGTKNHDWEDLAQDGQGNIFIGDFGNNDNKRKNLQIYKWNPKQPGKVETIHFSYADQKEFPPGKDNRNFDCEGFAWNAGHLYLFTKNRGRGKMIKCYRLPAEPGTYKAEPIEQINSGPPVTSADFSPDGKLLALIGNGKVLLFPVTGGKLLSGKPQEIKLELAGQVEAVVFVNDTDFLFCNEDGRLFKATKQ